MSNSDSTRSDYFTNVSLGNVTDKQTIHKFGHNSNISTTLQDLWTPGGVRTWLTEAAIGSIVSTSINDTSSGTGARTVKINGLDGDWNELYEIVTLNGTTPVMTTQTFMRINRMQVIDCGTYAGTLAGANLGTITLTISGSTQAEIHFDNGVGTGQTEQSHYSIPARKNASINGFILVQESSKSMDYLFMSRTNGNLTSAPYSARRNVFSVAGFLGDVLKKDFKQPMSMPEKTDLWVAGRVSTGSATASINYELMLSDM